MKFVSMKKVNGGKFLSRYDIVYETIDGGRKNYEMVSRSGDRTEFHQLHDHDPEAVIMIMHDPSGEKILINREFRLAMGEFIYNFPAGLVDEGEDWDTSAARELREETGLAARPEEFLDADRLCQLMLEAQKKAYGDGLDQTCLHPYMWLCKGHYYSGSLSFYNFPYAFGGLFARGLYAKYQQEGEKFVPLYKEMLHATSVNDVEDTAKIAGIDLTDKAFWRQGLQSLADEIDLFCDLVK